MLFEIYLNIKIFVLPKFFLKREKNSSVHEGCFFARKRFSEYVNDSMFREPPISPQI